MDHYNWSSYRLQQCEWLMTKTQDLCNTKHTVADLLVSIDNASAELKITQQTTTEDYPHHFRLLGR